MQRQLHHVRYLLYNVCCLRDQEIPTNRKAHKIIASSCHLILSKATVWNCLWGNALKRSPGIIRKSRVSYPGPGFLSSATWPSLPKKHYNGLNQTKPKTTQLSQVCIKSTVKISCDKPINAIIIIAHAVRKRCRSASSDISLA